MQHKFKKDVGFIKSHSSSKKELPTHKLKESSDSFSSFQYEPRKKNQQFSPYRHPIEKESKTFRVGQFKSNKDDHRLKHETNKNNNRQEPQCKFTNQMLRNNFIHQLNNQNEKYKVDQLQKNKKQAKHRQKEDKCRFGKDEEQQNIYHFQNNHSSDESDTPKLGYQEQQNEEEELSLSNINQFKQNKQSKLNELQNYTNQYHKTKQLNQKYYLEQAESENDVDQLNKNTLKYKSTNNKKHKKKSEQDQQSLIMEWDKRQFKDKSIKTTILNQNMHNKKEQSDGIYRAKGGICFDLDTREFVSKNNGSLPVYQKHRREKPQLNTRQQILRRRQIAKIYDRKTRVKLFGYL